MSQVICNRAGFCDYCAGCIGNEPHEPYMIEGEEGQRPSPCTTFYRCPDACCEVRCVPTKSLDDSGAEA